MSVRKRRGLALLIMGLVMVLCAGGMYLMYERQDAMAGQNSAVLLAQLTNYTGIDDSFHIMPEVPEEPEEPRPTEPAAGEMPTKSYSGYSMIGSLEVPSVGIALPILSEWSYELLNVAPCRYSGSLAGEDLILLGHNYRSHFTPLHTVAVGAEVTFTDVNGVATRYQVALIETMHKSDGDRLPSEYPLSLVTCTAGGQNRLVIRCEEAEE